MLRHYVLAEANAILLYNRELLYQRCPDIASVLAQQALRRRAMASYRRPDVRGTAPVPVNTHL